MTRHRRTTAAHRVAAVVVGVLSLLTLMSLAMVTNAAPATASTYRYWTYWWGTDTGKPHSGWKFASQGPASHGVGDGWVLGWRFATSSVAGGKQPRVSATYDSLCSTPKPTDGSVRVALVIDYGTSTDAPPGEKPPTTSTVRVECLVLPASARGTSALSQASPPVVVRAQNGLICGLDGYPARECAPVVADPTPTATPKPSTSRAPTRSPTPAASTTKAGNGAQASARPGAASPSIVGGTQAGAADGSASPVTSQNASATDVSSAPDVSGSASTAASDPSSSESPLPAVAGAPSSATTDQSGTGPIGVVAAVVVVGGLAGSAWWTSRRGGRTT
jgi:hypothetical protein